METGIILASQLQVSLITLENGLAGHMQHHAAQLGLRVQFLTGQEMKWVGKG